MKPTSNNKYLFPGEFELHEQTWLMWPERTDIYPFKASKVQVTYVELVKLIAEFEPVTLLVSNCQYENVINRLGSYARIIEMSSDGNWLRDTGPTFVKDIVTNTLIGVCWKFNAWGGIDKGAYFPYNLDDLVSDKISRIERIKRIYPDLYMEGGAIISDGAGTIMLTKESLFNSNPKLKELDISKVEKIFKDFLGAQKIIWLEEGLYLDEAGGHIDGICTFLSPTDIALHWTEDSSDPQYQRSLKAYDLLKNATNIEGETFTIHKIPQPGPFYVTQEESDNVDYCPTTAPRNVGDRLPGTYINFYFVNGGLILPVFGVPEDEIVYDFLSSFYEGVRKIVKIESRNILLGGGNVHCMVQQQPKL